MRVLKTMIVSLTACTIAWLGFLTAEPAEPRTERIATLGYVAEEWRAGDAKIGPFRPLVVLRNDRLELTDGRTLRDGMKFWAVVPPGGIAYEITGLATFGCDAGDPECEYHARFRNAAPPLWTILTSKPLPGVFRQPTGREREYFFVHNTTCVV